MCTPSIIFVMLSTPHTHENVELGAAKHGAVHIPHQTLVQREPPPNSSRTPVGMRTALWETLV